MVNIDTVYQRVLAIANKEQRGYITPQEFNLFANQAQLDIFEQYFYDQSQFLRLPGNSTSYSDIITNLILYSFINIILIMSVFQDCPTKLQLTSLFSCNITYLILCHSNS